MATKGRPELINTFKLPEGNSSTQAFLTAAKGMLLKAETERELLVSKGMSETLLDDLAKAVSEFEATNEKSRASRRDHVRARADLAAVSVEIQEQVRLLDGLVRYRFGKDPEVMAVWESSRNVAASSWAAAKLYLSKLPMTAVDLLHDRVLQIYEGAGISLERLLADNGREFCGRPLHHPFELYLAVQQIEHRNTKIHTPKTNGFCERFNRTLKEEFFSVAYRKTLYESLQQLQDDLDGFLHFHNE